MGLLIDLKKRGVRAPEIIAAIINAKRANPIVVVGRGSSQQSDLGTVIRIDPAGAADSLLVVLGKVTTHGPDGEADFGDGIRQWVELGYIAAPGEGLGSDEPAVMGTHSAAGAYETEIVPATNLTAMTGVAIAPLLAGTPVAMLAAEDVDGNRRWVILGGGASLAAPQYQGMFLGGTADNAVGWAFPFLHAIPL